MGNYIPSGNKPLKILVLGDKSTGKHSYVNRLTNNEFSSENEKHEECEISLMKATTDEGQEIQLQFYVIGGEYMDRTSTRKYYSDIHGAIIMFDITNVESFERMPSWKRWIDEGNPSKNIKCLLLASKSDLEQNSELDEALDGIKTYCEAFKFSSFWRISNKENTNIEESIRSLIKEILQPTAPSIATVAAQSTEPLSPPTPTLTPAPTIPIIPEEYTFKVLVIGDAGTGKTAIIERYTKNIFSGSYRTTIGTDIALKKLQYTKNITVKIHIWDIAGEERFGAMTQVYYKNAVGCLIVFDLAAPATLTRGALRWKGDFDKKVNFDPENRIPCILVGNKCDVAKTPGSENELDMNDFCRQHGFTQYFTTSAKENINVDKCFAFLVDEILKNAKPTKNVRRRQSTINLQQEPPKAKKNRQKCCSS